MNVQSVVDEIHARIEKQESQTLSSGDGMHVSRSEVAALRSACERMYHSRNLVGEMPPSPGTFRAKAGQYFVRFVQRLLFWYTPQIRQFNNETTQALGHACRLLEKQLDVIAALERDLKILRSQRVHGSPAEFRAASTSNEPSLPKDFEYSLQDHFRGSEAQTRAKLSAWLDRIRRADAGIERSGATWLDIGCGRGEWLSLVAEAGYQALGVDSNPMSIDHCRAKGLRAELAEGLDYLEAQPDGSLAVITAFHVAEHLPTDRLLALLRLSRTKLCLGGLLVLETPNAANVSMGAHRFWNDPTHVRPVTSDFLEFSLRYFGFSVAPRIDLNPSPDEEHLPYTEVDLVRRVDELFYGPQDYGLIGRRAA